MATIAQTLQIAVKHRQANRLDQAEIAYRQVLKTQPDHPDVLSGLGMVAQQRGEFQQAEEFFNAALMAQPHSVQAWFSLGNLQQAQGKLPEAALAYQKAIALKPDAAPIYNNLGYTFEQQGKLDEAITCYQKALEIQPNCVEAEVSLGNILHAQGKLLLEQKSYYEQLNYNLALAREKAGDWQNAAAYYQKAVELNPENGELYLKLGRVYQQQKDFTQAIAAYRQGLKLVNPHYAQAVAAYQDAGSVLEIIPVPPIPEAKVTVGAYDFPAIPPVADPDQPRPFWTVIIPVYNRTDYLLECLSSVLRQWPGEQEMEILVIDNASTSPVSDLVNSIAGGVIRYYRQQQNIGGVRNYNAGIALSRGQWVHVLHDDDCILPGFYARLQQSLAGCPDSVGVACTGFEYINEKGNTIGTGEIVSLYGERKGIMQNWLPQIGVCGLVTIPAMVVRRTTHEHLGGYSPEVSEIADWEIFKRYASFYDWWYELGILALYREHTQKMTPENWLSGRMAGSIRLAIEISDSYFPVQKRAEITAKARSQNFNYCLQRAAIPLKAGNLSGALYVIQEALKIDHSPQAIAKLFAWLSQDEAAPLRDEIISKVLLSSDEENKQLSIATELKHLQPAITA